MREWEKDDMIRGTKREIEILNGRLKLATGLTRENIQNEIINQMNILRELQTTYAVPEVLVTQYCFDEIEKTAKNQGNGAMVLVPKRWAGKKVKVLLLEEL